MFDRTACGVYFVALILPGTPLESNPLISGSSFQVLFRIVYSAPFINLSKQFFIFDSYAR